MNRLVSIRVVRGDSFFVVTTIRRNERKRLRVGQYNQVTRSSYCRLAEVVSAALDNRYGWLYPEPVHVGWEFTVKD